MQSVQLLVVAKFLFAYLLVLAVPGPNMLAIGGLAALRGFRAVIPLCCGIAIGAGILAFFLYSVTDAVPENGVWQAMTRIVGAVLLLAVGVRIAALTPPHDVVRNPNEQPKLSSHLTEFGAGFFTAFMNPITAAYFAAQFIGPLADMNDTGVAVVTLVAVPTVALVSGLTMAAILARPLARRAALAWHRPICAAVAVILGMLAFSTIRPLMG
jgi:threonine/homoserine/homoserine lactone efflux protein